MSKNKAKSLLVIFGLLVLSLIQAAAPAHATIPYPGTWSNASIIQDSNPLTKWAVHNETVIYNDQPASFWDDTNCASLVTDHTHVKVGTTSTQINQGPGGTYIWHTVSPTINLNYDLFTIWFYTPSSFDLEIRIRNPAAYMYDYYLTQPGWNEINLHKSDFTNTGGASWSGVSAVMLTYFNEHNFNKVMYVDEIKNYSPTYYQVFRGTTLLYTGASEPDLSTYKFDPSLVGYDDITTYLGAGDYLGLALSPFIVLLGDIFGGVLMFVVMIPLYNRTQSLDYCLAVWTVLSSILTVGLPLLTFRLAYVFLVIGVAGILWRIFMGRG